MSKNFFYFFWMESQFVDTKLQSVFFKDDGEKAEIFDGAVVTLGDFATEEVYSASYTRAAGTTKTILDLNAREAGYCSAVTDAGLFASSSGSMYLTTGCPLLSNGNWSP